MEEFREKIGFTDLIYGPKVPTLAVWLEFKDGFPRVYKFMLGGPSLGVMFDLDHFYGADGKGGNQELPIQVQCSMDAGDVRWRRGSSVSEWQPIEDMFKDIITSPGSKIDWSKGNSIFTRYYVCKSHK